MEDTDEQSFLLDLVHIVYLLTPASSLNILLSVHLESGGRPPSASAELKRHLEIQGRVVRQ